MSEQPTKNVPFMVAGVVLIVVASLVMLTPLLGMAGMSKGAQRVVVPSETTITLAEAGKYTVFHEYESEVDGVRYEGHRPPSDVRLESVLDGSSVIVERRDGSSKYSYSGRSGVSVYQFEIKVSGDYVLHAGYGGENLGKTVLSIVHWHMDWVMFGVTSSVFSVLLAAGVLLISKGRMRIATTEAGRVSQGGFVYENHVMFSGDSEKVLDQARAVFMALNFRDFESTRSKMVAYGPGMHKSSEPPLLGATKIELRTENSRLNISAELGGVRFMRNFLYIFPPALCLGMGGFFFVLFSAMDQDLGKTVMFLPMMLLAPWLIIAPVMARSIRNRTTIALDSLLEDLNEQR